MLSWMFAELKGQELRYMYLVTKASTGDSYTELWRQLNETELCQRNGWRKLCHIWRIWGDLSRFTHPHLQNNMVYMYTYLPAARVGCKWAKPAGRQQHVLWIGCFLTLCLEDMGVMWHTFQVSCGNQLILLNGCVSFWGCHPLQSLSLWELRFSMEISQD